MEILCFYAGIAFIYASKRNALLFLSLCLYWRPKISPVIWFIAAIAYGALHQWWTMPRGIPNVSLIQQADLYGKVTAIPITQGDKVSFTFTVDRLNGKPVQADIAMACYQHCPEVHVGQYWRLLAKLRKPRNLANPGGFDYVGWLKSRHIYWLGSARRGSFTLLNASSRKFSLLQLREHLCDKLARLNPDVKTLGIIEALTLGINSHIDKADWDLFRRTGTTHLIDISGAHIGLVAGITFKVVCWCWPRFGRLALIWPAHRVASLCALFFAIFYTFLSGFAVPAQRALVACSFMLLRYFCNQRFTVWQAWRYALLTVLILEPHSVLLVGFYLSFIGVAVLILINQRIIAQGMRKILALQLACLVGLMPLTLYWFSYGAVNGIFANLFAIPWVELWIVPLGLVITILPESMLLSWMMFVLKGSVSILLFSLTTIDSLAFLNLTFSFNSLLPPLAIMSGLCIALLIPLRQFIFPASMMVILATIPYHLKIKPGVAKIDILDVGQGLAVIVNTAHHTLIYDTGVQFFQGSDMGKLAIIPYLKTLGIKQLDKIVISHPDLDHRGGLKSIEANYPIQELLVDDPTFYHRGISCHHHVPWEWDGVSFRFFSINQFDNKKNNHSCVLQISTRSGQLLLTGDIEKTAEEYLLRTYGQQLASSVMLIPHHASKTSSTSAFVKAVSPKYAIVSYGFDNRYHFPHLQALSHYKQQGISVFNTVRCGMTTVILDSSEHHKPRCYTHQKSSIFTFNENILGTI
jgi:competence protein ComEC